MPKFNEVIYKGVRYESESEMCQSLGLNRQTYDSAKRRFHGDKQKAIKHLLKKTIVKEVVEEIIRDTGKERFKKDGPRKTKDIMEDYNFE